jgi:predicted transposase/invertase (TIGR01784 family)
MKHKKNQNPSDTKRNKKMFYGPILDTYINPFTDYGFKKLFGEECNKDILLDFLNELLHKEQGKIVSITYLNPEQLGLTEDFRKVVFDLYCENEKGERFIVEMQKSLQPYFKERTLYYSTFPIIEQGKFGKWNFDLKAVYVIAILDFVFEEDKHNLKKYRYDVKLADIETHKVFYDKLTFIYLEMPKFNKTIDECNTRFDKWMFVIRNLERLDHLPEKLRERIFEKIFAAAEVAKFSQKEYCNYARDFGKMSYDYLSYKYRIEKGVKEAKKKGMKEGREEGREEGMKEGREEGM